MKYVCSQCQRTIRDNNRTVIYANRIFCDITCVETYQDTQKRVLHCEEPSPGFGYTPPIYDP
jgi:hypothetical protein